MPVSEKIRLNRQRRHEARQAAAEKVIPDGSYCYRLLEGPRPTLNADGALVLKGKTQVCPFLKIRKDKPTQRNGYCRHMKAGDFSPPHARTSLLWDAVKECGLNRSDDGDGE